MQAGKLRFNLVLQSPRKQADGYNEPLADGGSYDDVKPVQCSLRALSANERFKAAHVQLETTHVIKCRYDADITSERRFKFYDSNKNATRYFNIVSVRDEEEKGVELLIYTNEMNGE